jgi:ATP-dependent DNA helicase RecG
MPKIEPPAVCEQTRLPVREGKEVLILETTTALDVPYSYDGRPYKRIGPTTSLMPQSEYQQRLLSRSHALQRWENQPAEGYSANDLDTEEINRTIREALQSGRLESRSSDPFDSLDRLQLRVDGQLLRAAVVLFGRKLMPYYPQCTVRLARFKAWFNFSIFAGDKSWVAGVELATASEPPARKPRIWGRRPSGVDPSHPEV